MISKRFKKRINLITLFCIILFIGLEPFFIYPFTVSSKGTPKTSNQSISINSPQNKVYYGLMKGYYPGTYGFENDDDYTFPTGWGDGCNPSCFAYVIGERYSHRKILWLWDGSDTGSFYCSNNFDNQNFGTIEYWINMADVSKYVVNSLYTGGFLVKMFVSNGKWKCKDGYSEKNIPNVSNPGNNKWHHVKIHFECTTGNYQGLAQYSWKVIIDNTDSGPMKFFNERTPSYINTILFSSDLNQKYYDVYLDAIGYSWDPFYNVGDNEKEGLLLEFEPDNLALMEYKLNNNSNIPILGDTVIPMPENGHHTIQVFGTGYNPGIMEFEVLRKVAIITCIAYYETINDAAYCNYDANHWFEILNSSGYNCYTYGDEHPELYDYQYNGLGNETTVRATIQNFAQILEHGAQITIIFSGHGFADETDGWEYDSIYSFPPQYYWVYNQMVPRTVFIPNMGPVIVFIPSLTAGICLYDAEYQGSEGNYYESEIVSDLSLFKSGVQITMITATCHSGGIGPNLVDLPNYNDILLLATCTGCGYGRRGWKLESTNFTHWLHKAFTEGQVISFEDAFTWIMGEDRYISEKFGLEHPADTPQMFDGNPKNKHML